NFLYSPDLGDAPDPWMGVFNQYPTLVHNVGKGRVLNGIQLDAPAKGAEHVFGIKPRQGGRNYTYEWLARFDGPGVTPECEANLVDRDPLDDGVTWYPNPPIWGRPLTVTTWLKYARDAEGNAHDYPARGLFANAWIDLNQNCIWEEWFLSAGFGPVPPPGANTVATTTASATVLLPPAIDPTRPVWLRARVDYGENVGIVSNVDGTLAADKGAAQFGEVEDYPLFCQTKYEQQWPYHLLPYPVDGVAMVFVGGPEPGDQLWSPQVDDGDCIVGMDPTAIVTHIPSRDEMAVEYPVPTLIPPSTPKHTGICRPVNPPARPVTLLRTFFIPDGTPCRATCSVEEVPVEARIPSANCMFGSLDNDTGAIDFVRWGVVGAVDSASGGWLKPGDDESPAPYEWSDVLRVSVSYRVSASLIPLENLSPCDPVYASLPLTTVGDALVTPDDPFVFPLSPDDVPDGSFLIFEVETSWDTNRNVNRQIVEFPDPVGGPTPVGDRPAPRQLALSNFPNPFNPGTTIRYTLPEAAVTSLRVYDVTGRLVRTLFAGERVPAGTFEVEWNGRDERGADVASGVYFFRIDAGTRSFTRKAVLLK
ncbi:MAG TPA: FlgD immunoglobulin-like domain containing protein, partial [Candidatus Krumholzibacteria bacterium]|nr:FlgD immunoglobulin-like domain containing protein [Candidatus Krumholzibacteria bacterium]